MDKYIHLKTLSIVFQYEILFCIQNSEDESLKETVRNLSKKYPHVDTQVEEKFH